ncbi:MAG: hypothetical protein BWX71_02143 [Deltaproteobacteria bacterium ADurb.Bin072]|nr:MAG: hypothetical protein BWX71_02143 [Deltaproteobacteria bacterium ADurb.Bin072]
MGLIPCLAMAFACSALSRMASMPPWTRGCRVLSLPSIISGNPVYSEMSTTVTPLSFSVFAVPPVEMISTPKEASSRTKSVMPFLSVTLTKARVILGMCAPFRGRMNV